MPIDPVTAYIGGKVIKGIGDVWSASKQQKMASQTPTLEDNEYSSSYGNYLKQYAATGPFSPSQQANFSREVMGQSMSGFNQMSTNIMQRGAATGLEDSAVQSEQLAGVDQNKAMARLNIARRLANKNQELRLSYIDKMGAHGQNVYSSALARHKNKMAYAGAKTKAWTSMAGDIVGSYGQQVPGLPAELTGSG